MWRGGGGWVGDVGLVSFLGTLSGDRLPVYLEIARVAELRHILRTWQKVVLKCVQSLSPLYCCSESGDSSTDETDDNQC